MDDGSVGDMAKKLHEDGSDPVDSITKRLNSLTGDLATSGDEVSSFEDEFVIIGGHPEHNYFDAVVGAIEDIVMGEDFHEVQSSYLDKYWPEFSEDQTENLHSHFEMFKEYSQGISSFIEEKLKTLLEHFDMEVFVEQLTARGELDGDIFDMLFTLIDYVKFKELLLDYRAMREGKSIDLSNGISIKALQPDPPSNV
jgi:ADP-ribosylation factor 2-binding protein